MVYSKIIEYSLPITHYPLPITYYLLPITHSRFPIPDSRFPKLVTPYLQPSSLELPPNCR
ncbi:MAG: hypothetical protein F6K49_30560 [Moorea sp. SIO3I6]|nr:hypothetical protein [Moorena sp. SIO3I6]